MGPEQPTEEHAKVEPDLRSAEIPPLRSAIQIDHSTYPPRQGPNTISPGDSPDWHKQWHDQMAMPPRPNTDSLSPEERN